MAYLIRAETLNRLMPPAMAAIYQLAHDEEAEHASALAMAIVGGILAGQLQNHGQPIADDVNAAFARCSLAWRLVPVS
jgi:hypothetical protein